MEENDNDHLPDWIDADRKRGIITPSDRKYLAEKAEYKEQAARNKRFRIRERVKNAFFDFNDLRVIGAKDRKTIFDQLGEEGPTLINSLEFLYLGITEMEERFGETGIDLFGELLADAIEEGERRRGHIADVDVEIDVERTEPAQAEVMEKITSGTATIDEFRYFTQEGSLSEVLERLAEENKPLKAKDSDGTDRELLEADEVRKFVSNDDDALNEGE